MNKHISTNNYIPKMRFSEFHDKWNACSVFEMMDRVVDPVLVTKEETYREIGIRSHGKGIFHKTPVKGEDLGSKRVYWIKENVFALNIVFAWEQAIAITTEKEKGMIASHRFPMYSPKENKLDLNFILNFLHILTVLAVPIIFKSILFEIFFS